MATGGSTRPLKFTGRERKITSNPATSTITPQKSTVYSGNVNRNPSVIVAIDFGTTYSGYALSFEGSRENIITASHGGQLPKDRVPTAILLKKDKTIQSFGYDAIEDYEKLSNEKNDVYFFQHFKMALYNTPRLSRKTKICDFRGRKVRALLIFSQAIGFFQDMALQIIEESVMGIKKNEIHWVITIPAIWTDSSRQFMREAATSAGIPVDNLRLVLEPEAASLFCQEQRVLLSEGNLEPLPEGHKYILADLGGGTVDICVHTILAEGKLRELYRATGGNLGGNLVNDAFVALIKEIVGDSVWTNVINDHVGVYFELLREFEKKKKTFSNKSKSVNLSPEYEFLEIIHNDTGKSMNDLIQKSPYNENLMFKEDIGKLIIKKELVESFFRKCVDGVVHTVQAILEQCGDPDIKTLMLVGGFAESPYLREIMQAEFNDFDFILQQDTRLAVLKGAVMMGYMPRNIVQRRARFTYGFSYRVPFIPGKHPESLECTRDGKDWCGGIFNKLIEKGQLLEYGDTFISEGYKTAVDPELKHEELYTRLWRSTRENPRYCRYEEGEEDCELVGKIVVKPPPDGWPEYWDFEQHLIVGETEFTIKYINKNTPNMPEEYDAQVDLL